MLIEKDPGTRARRLRARRRRRLGIALLFVLVAGGGVSGALLLSRRSSPAHSKAVDATGARQSTLLLAMTAHDDPSRQADSLTLFGVDARGRNPVSLFLPVGTLGQIPGQGFDAIGKALMFGHAELERLTVENLLGFGIDRAVVVDDVTLGAIVDSLGGIDLDVQQRLFETQRDGTKHLVFRLGAQHMDAADAVGYLTFRADGESEIDRFVRARAVWEAIFAARPERLSSAITGAVDPDDARALAGVLRLFARATADARAYEVLPADPVGSGGLDDAYKLDESRLKELVARAFAGSLPEPGFDVTARPRIEIRNGNGRPESGELAAAVLIPAGMKIEVTGNAASFDFRSTRIVVYGDDERSLELGRRIRALLGVGEVEIGTRGQTVVDATVVVGRDLVQRKG